MTYGLELTAAEVITLRALDGKPLRQEVMPDIEARLLKLELAGQNESGGLYRTPYGALRLLLARD